MVAALGRTKETAVLKSLAIKRLPDDWPGRSLLALRCMAWTTNVSGLPLDEKDELPHLT